MSGNSTSTPPTSPTSSTVPPESTTSSEPSLTTSPPADTNTPTTAPLTSSDTSTPFTSSSLPPTTSSSSSTTSSESSTTSTTPTTTPETSTTPTPTTSPTPSTTPTSNSIFITTIPGETAPITTTITSFATAPGTSGSSSTSSSASNTATAIGAGGGGSSSSLHGGGLIAVAVVIPIVGVAALVLAGIFFWRKRKQRKDAEDLRRKEVEDYGYNPNDDPTLPAVGGVAVGAASDGPFEMREDDQGYRGWGATTVAGSSARNPSTTMSNANGPALSEGTSPTHGPVSDTQSNNPLMGANGRPLSESSEVLGALGPAAAGNRTDINRGPSNASSSYSAANRSDGSGEAGAPGGAYGQAQYYSNETYNGYPETYGNPPGRAEMGGQPIIRDNLARRATRIENPSHFPQPSAGISQNF